VIPDHDGRIIDVFIKAATSRIVDEKEAIAGIIRVKGQPQQALFTFHLREIIWKPQGEFVE
jgi:hypothetical protein